MVYLRGEAKTVYKKILKLIEKKDQAGLEHFSTGFGMTLARSCACLVMAATSYPVVAYFLKEDLLTDEFTKLFSEHGIENKDQ